MVNIRELTRVQSDAISRCDSHEYDAPTEARNPTASVVSASALDLWHVLPDPAPADQLEQHHDDCEHQKDVKQTAHSGPGNKPEDPKHGKNNGNCEQHDLNSFGLTTELKVHVEHAPALGDHLCGFAHSRHSCPKWTGGSQTAAEKPGIFPKSLSFCIVNGIAVFRGQGA